MQLKVKMYNGLFDRNVVGYTFDKRYM